MRHTDQRAADEMSGASSSRTLLYAFLSVWFFSPAQYAIPNALHRFWQFSTFAVTLCIVIYYCARCRIWVQWVGFVSFFFTYYVLSSVFAKSDGSILTIGYYTSKCVGFVTLVFVGLEHDERSFLKGFLISGLTMCCINFLTVMRYSGMAGGMQAGELTIRGTLTNQRWFFFTHDNGSIFYYLPVMTAQAFYAIKYKSLLSRRIAFAFCFATLFMYIYLSTTTALIVSLIFALLMLFVTYRIKNGGDVFVLSNYHLVMGLAFLVIVTVVFFSSFPAFQYVIEAFNKSRNINSRFYVWTSALRYFEQSPLLGMGQCENMTNVLRISFNHCHNLLVQILYQGGLISLAFFLVALFGFPHLSTKQLKHSPENYVLILGSALFLVASSMDFYVHFSLQYMPIVMYGHRCLADRLTANQEAMLAAKGRRLS